MCIRDSRQTERAVGLDQCIFPAFLHVDRSQRLRCEMAEQFASSLEAGQHRFGHAIVQQAGDGFPFFGIQGATTLDQHMEGNDALDTLDGIQITVPGNIGGLRRPRRNCTDARRHEEQFADFNCGRLLFEQRCQLGALFGGCLLYTSRCV